MKKAMILFFVLLYAINCNSQAYIPFPIDSAAWFYTRINTAQQVPPVAYAREMYFLNGTDTIVNANTYHKLMLRSCSLVLPNANNIAVVPDVVRGGIREAAGKIFFIDSGFSNPEVLLYDFTLQVGDSVPLVWRYMPDNCMVVASIDSMLLGTVYHRVFVTDNNYKFIEGVGAYDSGLFPWQMVSETTSMADFDCFYSGAVSYATGIPHACSDILPYGTPTSVARIAGKEGPVDIYPNPAKDVLHITYGRTLNAKIEILDMTGRALLRSQLHPDISVTSLAAGFYFVKITDAAGNIIGIQKIVKE